MCTKSELGKILGLFAVKAREVFGEKLNDVILFGSYARGDYHEDSDIDIMLIADIAEEQVMHYVYMLSDFLSDLSLEYNVVVSPVIEPLAKYKAYKDVIPFLQKVQKEGVRIAA